MSDAAALDATSRSPAVIGRLGARIGWRNLWRNRRRTWLTSGGIAFAVLLVVFFMALQFGQYEIMEENATTLIAGHIQVQALDYVENARFEDTIRDAASLVARLESVPGIESIAPRAEAFALVSADERSFGAQVLGIDLEAEERTVRFVRMLVEGTAPGAPEEAVVGRMLARNLGVAVGDEVVILGSGKEGGVAALVLVVSGVLETGFADLDRSLLLASLATVQEAFGLDDEVHTLAIRAVDIEASRAVVRRLEALLPEGLDARNWDEVLPELKQAIEVDRIGGQIMYWILMLLVVFSVVNSFIMTVFERTREFGMLLAIGMRPGKVIAMLQWEALFVWALGVALGLGVAVLLILWLADVGIYLGAAMEAYATQFYMPSRMYPTFTREALLTAPVVMLIGTQLAAFLPAQRIRRLRPVEALRVEA